MNNAHMWCLASVIAGNQGNILKCHTFVAKPKNSETKEVKGVWCCYFGFAVGAQPKEICSLVNEQQENLQLWTCALWYSPRSLAASPVAHQITPTCWGIVRLSEHASRDSKDTGSSILFLGNWRNLWRISQFLRSSYMQLISYSAHLFQFRRSLTCSQSQHK